MDLSIILLHLIVKSLLVVILTFNRFVQMSINSADKKVFWGDIIVGTITWTFFNAIIEGRVIMWVFAVMILSTTLIVDNVIGEMYSLQDKAVLKKKLIVGQGMYLLEVIFLIYAFNNGLWGKNETIVLEKIGDLL